MKRRALDPALLLPLLAVAVAYRSVPGFDLVGDAVFLIADNSQMRSWSWLPHVLWSDYFEADAGLRIGYWRPWTKGSWLIETLVVGRAWIYPVVNAAWLAIAAAGVHALARTLGASRASAAVGACLVAVHPAAYEPACLVMARSDLVCAACVTWAIVAWLRWRDPGEATPDGAGARRAAYALAHVAALVGAFGSKETSVLVIPLLACWAGLDGDLRAGRRRRLLTLVPAVLIATVYFVLRAQVVESSVAGELGPRLARITAGLAIYARGLQPIGFESGIRNLSYQEAASPTWIAAGVGVAVAWALGLVAAVRARRNGVAAMLLWCAASLAPVLLIGDLNTPGEAGVAYAYADRWLLHCVLAVGVLAALGLDVLGADPRRVVIGGLAVWIVAACAVGPVAHAEYRDAPGLLTLEDRDFEATPERFRTAFATCRYVERHATRVVLDPARLDEAMRIAAVFRTELGCPQSLDLDLTMFNALVAAERWQDALPYVEHFRDVGPWRERYHVALLVGATLLRNGEPGLALAPLREAEHGYEQRCRAIMARGQAMGLMHRWTEAATALERAYDCFAERGDAQPELLRAAASAALRDGRLEMAGRLGARFSQTDAGAAP